MLTGGAALLARDDARVLLEDEERLVDLVVVVHRLAVHVRPVEVHAGPWGTEGTQGRHEGVKRRSTIQKTGRYTQTDR